ncbi:MAG: glycosyltransferase family 4 protein, partial [Ruminococcus sp.]|nr:glycosyltransferase family 4 protein [Ruminococcus sp.]
MRVIQLLTTVSFGDAVSNDTIALRGAIEGMGYKTAIYAENIDSRLPKNTAEPVSCLKNVSSDDIIIYHKSTGTDLSFKLEQYKCRKLMIYHNVTPPEFFRPYNIQAAALTEYGLEGARYLRDKIDYCLAVSSFNMSNLRDMGYTCPIDIRPILIPFEDYKKTPDEEIIRRYTSDGWTNIVFVGRIAPNKRHENLIRAFYEYKKINPKSRLILVGSYSGMENYYERLVKYTKALGLEDVIFTGHIKFNQILAWYRAADVFLCMSEHEGFCVPLVEAMFFDVPIVAYDSSA